MLRGPKPINRAISKTARQLFEIATAKGIPRKAIASALGVHATTVHHWARGRSDMTVGDMEIFARFLSLTVSLEERK